MRIVIENSSLFCPPKVKKTADFEELGTFLMGAPLKLEDFVRLRRVCKELYTFMEGRKYMMFDLT